MMEALRNWVVNICTTVIFMTAVEMILPENKMKKYAKFVLGLILIAVLINPIIKLFDGQYDISTYASKASKFLDEKGYENKLEKYKETGMKTTIDTFKLNLEKECEKKLKEKYPNNNYKVSAEVSYDSNTEIVIKGLKIGVKDGDIEKVKRVEVSTKGSYGEDNNILRDDKAIKIKDFLSNELKVSNDAIVVYKL